MTAPITPRRSFLGYQVVSILARYKCNLFLLCAMSSRHTSTG